MNSGVQNRDEDEIDGKGNRIQIRTQNRKSPIQTQAHDHSFLTDHVCILSYWAKFI